MGRLGGEAAEGGRRVEGAVPRAVRVTHSGVVGRYVSMLKRMRTEYSAASPSIEVRSDSLFKAFSICSKSTRCTHFCATQNYV